MLVEAPSCGMNGISIQRSQSFQNDNSKNLNNKSSNASLEVTDEKFIRLMSMHEEHLPIFMNILQNRYESMMHTIENMTLTREEQKELDEKLKYIKKLQQTIKDNKIEEDEAIKMLDLVLSNEDKELLDEQYIVQSKEYI